MYFVQLPLFILPDLQTRKIAGETKILYLPSQIFVVCMSNVQGLGCERVGLHLHICSCDLVDETGFTHIGET